MKKKNHCKTFLFASWACIVATLALGAVCLSVSAGMRKKGQCAELATLVYVMAWSAGAATAFAIAANKTSTDEL